MNEYELALSKMQDVFTSHEFLKQLRKGTLPKAVIEQGRHVGFLEKSCEQVNKKTWKKLMSVDSKGQIALPLTPTVILPETTEVSAFKINQAIELLKANGYKIYKLKEELV